MFVIRRPAVWTAVILIITILAFNIISQKRIYKKQYYLDDMFKNKSRIETIIYGEFESAISKEKTVSIILKNVSFVIMRNALFFILVKYSRTIG